MKLYSLPAPRRSFTMGCDKLSLMGKLGGLGVLGDLGDLGDLDGWCVVCVFMG